MLSDVLMKSVSDRQGSTYASASDDMVEANGLAYRLFRLINFKNGNNM